MFLATTALTEFWEDDEELLFLGAWCRRYDRRSDWEHRKFHVLPCLWNDRERFYRAVRYLDEYGERLLGALADYLNAVHGFSMSHRYWRILIGPWLLHYLHALYDRHAHLAEGFHQYPQARTIVMDTDSFRVPVDTLEAIESLTEDRFNLQLCSHVLRGMGYRFPAKDFPVESKPARESRGPSNNLSPRRLVRNALCHLAEALSGLNGKQWHIALGDLYCDWADVWAITRKTRFRAFPDVHPVEGTVVRRDPVFNERRLGLGSLPAANEFESLFARSCVYTFPTLFLEGFAEGREQVQQIARSRPAVIVSASDWLFNEPFKFKAAEASERGTRLVAVQHGGGYGTYEFSPAELHEKRLSDAFMAWGWAADDPERCKNLPSPRLSRLAAGRRSSNGVRRGDRILFVSTNHPRYLYRFHSMPVSSQMDDYFAWELRFLGALPEPIRAAVIFRPYVLDYGQAVRERISDRYPNVWWDDSQTFVRQLQDARLVVFDHRGTGCLETLAANIPTVLFWDQKRWEIRKEAEPYFDGLRKVGILWSSPEAAAEKLGTMFDDPSPWWQSEPVQDARRRFVERYALTREDWLDRWSRMLEEECRLGAPVEARR